MLLALKILFWASAAGVVYSYFAYPVLIWLAARVWGRRTTVTEMTDGELPSMTLLIAAHNEAAVIAERLRNALSLDYPHDKLEIVVASDGSRDATAEIVQSFADRDVRLIDYQVNRGKAATLNAAWSELRGEVVLLSDANTAIEPEAPRRLARWFCNAEIGAVCGRLVLVDPQTGRNVDGLYWRYETFLKRCESRLGALLGANGAIYAIRRECFTGIPKETIVDDFVIPLLARLQTGCRLVYDEEAVAFEETPAHIGDEFRRRVRIGAGGFQSLGLLWPLFSPCWGWLAFGLFSHKLMRWLCPFFLLAMAATNLALVSEPLYQVILILQASFYAVAWLGNKLPGGGPAIRLVRLATMFSGMNAALLVGFFRWLSGRQRGAWAPTTREARG